jgi:hypothetical protein
VAESAVTVATVIVGSEALRTVTVTGFANPAVWVPAMDRAIEAVLVRGEGTAAPTTSGKILAKGATPAVVKATPSRLAGSPDKTMLGALERALVEAARIRTPSNEK